MECQKKNIVNILEKGGVTEIKIQFQEERGENRKLVAELIKKLREYVDDDDESDLGWGSEENDRVSCRVSREWYLFHRNLFRNYFFR